jgi:predicted transcriptional regulator
VSKNVSIRNVFKVLSDQETERLFKIIIDFKDAESQILIVELGLSKRQYYDRINNLLKAGLIRRQKGRYELSSFGKVIFSLYKIAEKASGIYWKLEAIDNIKMSDKSHLAEFDYMKIIDILLNDVEIKEIFLHGDEYLVKDRLQDNLAYGRYSYVT